MSTKSEKLAISSYKETALELELEIFDDCGCAMTSSRSSARRLQYRSKSKSFGPSPHGCGFLSVRYYNAMTIQSWKRGAGLFLGL